MRLASSLITVSQRREGCHDYVVPVPRGRGTAPRRAAVYSVAAEPEHATWPDSSSALGTSGRPDPRELPLTRVAQQLGLCRQRLRKHCRGKASPASVPSLPAALPFVEVHPAWRVPTAEVEVQRPDGQRLRLSLYETSPALAPLLRTFVEHRCCSSL